MRVKVGDKIYDGNEQIVMVILNDKDKLNITMMAKECSRYCAYPENYMLNKEQIEKWMKE